MTKICVTKVEAAQRQIDMAIRLLFNNEDPVGIHSIAAAGFRILRDLAGKDNTQTWQMLIQCIRPEMRQRFFGNEVMNKLANFLKHADRDPNDIIDDVDEIINDGIIFLSCILYDDLSYKWTPEMRTFIIWYSGLYPDHIRNDLPWSAELETIAKEWRDLPRREQLAFGAKMLRLAGHAS